MRGKRKITLLTCLCMITTLAGCGKNNSNSETKNINSPENTKTDMTITVSPLNASKTNGGKFEGWGTSLCWWANRVGYSDSLAQQAADLFYGDDGLRLNIMRYNIGGGDDPTHNHIRRTDSEVPGYLVWDKTAQKYVYDYNADANQVNVMKRAVKAAGKDAIVEVFSNSPPYFMTKSGCSSGGTNPNETNIKDDYYDDFADYLANVTKYIQDELNIKVRDVSPMNEPHTNYWSAYSDKQEGCHVSLGADQSRVITEVAKALKKYGLNDVIIAASDETSVDTQIKEYAAYSDEAKAVLGRINTHTYGGSKLTELRSIAQSNNINLWMSEVDSGDASGSRAEQMGAGLWLGEKIISDMNGLSPSAWVLWQVIGSYISSTGYNGNRDSGMVNVNGGFWGTAVSNHDKNNIVLTQKYYSLGQFTRYIRPGSTIITGNGTSLAAYDSKKRELVIVAVNSDRNPKTVDFDLSQFKSIGDKVSAVRTSGNLFTGESWAKLDDISAYESGFISELKGNSITTFIVPDVDMKKITLKEISLKNVKVTGSEPWKPGQDPAKNVIDGNVSSFFDGVTDGWVELDLGKPVKFNTMGYAPRSGFEARMVDGSFYGSLDGKNWELISQIDTLPSAGLNYIYLKGGAKYQYIKYSVPEGKPKNRFNKEDAYNCNIAEIAFYSN